MGIKQNIGFAVKTNSKRLTTHDLLFQQFYTKNNTKKKIKEEKKKTNKNKFSFNEWMEINFQLKLTLIIFHFDLLCNYRNVHELKKKKKVYVNFVM